VGALGLGLGLLGDDAEAQGKGAAEEGGEEDFVHGCCLVLFDQGVPIYSAG
jgi:hypothetical protein